MSNACNCTPTLSGLRSYDEALALLLEHAKPLTGTETLPLENALGRILAEPVTSTIDVPGWDNSAMDGYAVRSSDLPAPGTALPVSQRVPAGSAPSPLTPGTAARIFTGAPIPKGADAVVMQEQTRREGDRVVFETVPEPGDNIRRAGEDIRAGATIIEAGTRLQPQHLGLAASVGVPRLVVRRRMKVAVLASGDELVMPGEPLRPGMIYNSNLFTAKGLLEALGCEVIDMGQVADTLEATRTALAKAAEGADLVLASGGVSVGEEDHVKPAVESLGSLDLWKIAIRPGKPLAFGHIGDTPFIGTPGNPVSLFATFLLFARPFILKSMGQSDHLNRTLGAVAAFDWLKPDKRREFHRARLYRGPEGENLVEVHPSRSSAVLSAVTWANGLVVLPENRVIRAGDKVEFMPFCELVGWGS